MFLDYALPVDCFLVQSRFNVGNNILQNIFFPLSVQKETHITIFIYSGSHKTNTYAISI